MWGVHPRCFDVLDRGKELTQEMTQDTVSHIIGKAFLDADFRDTLLAYPEQALSSFALND